MEKVHEFIGGLLDEKGITGMEPEVRQQLIEEMTNLLMQRIDTAAINALPEDKAIELADGLDNGTIKNEDVSKFMIDAGVNFEEIAMVTMVQFRDLYLGNTVAEPEKTDAADSKAVEKDNN